LSTDPTLRYHHAIHAHNGIGKRLRYDPVHGHGDDDDSATTLMRSSVLLTDHPYPQAFFCTIQVILDELIKIITGQWHSSVQE
jgi:hypothetical protein